MVQALQSTLNKGGWNNSTLRYGTLSTEIGPECLWQIILLVRTPKLWYDLPCCGTSSSTLYLPSSPKDMGCGRLELLVHWGFWAMYGSTTQMYNDIQNRKYIDFATYNIAVDGAAMIKTNSTGCNTNNGISSNLALSPLWWCLCLSLEATPRSLDAALTPHCSLVLVTRSGMSYASLMPL